MWGPRGGSSRLITSSNTEKLVCFQQWQKELKKKPPEYPQFHPPGTRSAAPEPQQQLVFVLRTLCNEHTNSKAIVFFSMFWIATYRNSNNKGSTDAAGWITKWTVVKARWQPEIYLTLGAMRLGGCGLHRMFDNVFASRTMCLTLITQVFLNQTLFFSPGCILSAHQASTSCLFSI